MAQQLQAVRQPAQTQPVAGRILQRVCSCGQHAEGGECAACKRKGTGTLQRAAVSGDAGDAEAPPIVHDVLRSSGQPLDDATRAYMEPRFGHDFGGVRVHADARAAASARAVNAVAYTVGNHVAFDAGQYRPENIDGKRLLAHELAHTLQQRGQERVGSPVQIASAVHPAEHQAHALASRVLEDRRPVLSAVAASPWQLARSNGKQKKFVAGADDLAYLERTLLQILDSVDDKTRATLIRNKTIVVGLVVDDDGDPTTVYTVNGNWTNRQLRRAADKAGVTRWEARPRTEGRGGVGAPGDAEQIMIGAADTNNFKVAAMAVSREVCADCKEEIKSYDRHGIKVIHVAVPAPSPRKGKRARSKKAAKVDKPTTTATPSAKVTPSVKPTPAKPSPKAPLTSPKPGSLSGVKGGRPAVRPSSRGGGGSGAAGAAAAVVGVALNIVARKYLQGEMDKKNEEAFQSKLQAQQPDIERMVADQEAAAQELEKQGKPIFVNVTLYVRYQTDVSGELGGMTVLMDLDVREVKVVPAKLEHVKESRLEQGFLEFAAKDLVGMSESLLTFSLSYPDLEVVSEPDPAALPAGGGCFIATACYGSPLAPEVQVLRQFRDEWLRNYTFGRMFIRSYYLVAPPIAAHLSRHESTRTAVRETVIAPIVDIVRAGQPRWRLLNSGSNYTHGSAR